MNDSIHELLSLIENAGYKSYIVGGYVRDFLWGLSNNDIDIVTNAPVSTLVQLFKNSNPIILKFNTLKFDYKSFNVDIAQMRKEEYDGITTSVISTSDLKDDYLRRDFTINAIYMDKEGKITSFDTSLDDCKNKVLKSIGDCNKKYNEDPSRILRGIYLLLKYDLKADDELFTFSFDNKRSFKVDINLMNRIIIKVLKLNKNKEFILLLRQCNLYDRLFKESNAILDVKPIDFLKINKYVFLDSIINKK